MRRLCKTEEALMFEHSPNKQHLSSISGPPMPIIEDQRVLTIIEAARLIGVSLATIKRIIADGSGPPIVQIGKRRIGIRVCDLRRWLDGRVRS
jgi:predicted DNA-binding transcriptional regulator AlpA